MATVKGTLGRETINSESRIRNVIKGFAEEEPLNTPLEAITSKLAKTRKVTLTARGWNPEWFEKARFPRTVTVTNAAGTGTSIVVSSASNLQAGHILENVGENILITSISTLTLTVLRNTPARASGGGINSIAAQDSLIVASTAAEEGAAKGPRMAVTPTNNSNFTQIFRRGFGITGTQLATDVYHSEGQLEEGIHDATVAIREEYERACLMHWGKESLPSSGSGATDQARKIMGGLPAYITNNYKSAAGTLTYQDLNMDINGSLRKGGNKRRLIMGGQNVAAVLSQFPESAIRTTTASKFWGMEITRFGGSGGWEADFIPNWQMEGEFWGGAMYVLDMENIHEYMLRELDIDRNTATPGTDATEVELLTEKTIVVKLADAHLLEYDIDA